MIEPKPLTEIVEMSVEEAVDLHERAWVKTEKYESNFFKSNYQFRPFRLSELVGCFDSAKNSYNYGSGGENYYTDGNIYIARKNDGMIEIKRVDEIFKDDWSWKSPRKINLYGPARNGSSDAIKIY